MFSFIVDWCSIITINSFSTVKDTSHLNDVYSALEICNIRILASSGILLEEIALYKDIGDAQDVNKSTNTESLYSLLTLFISFSIITNFIPQITKRKEIEKLTRNTQK